MVSRSHEAMYDDFINGRLSESDWTHEAHLVVCWIALQTRSVSDAIAHLRVSIKAHNRHVGTPNTEHSGYHETLTVYYVKAVAAAAAASPEALFDHPTCARGAPLAHWDEATLFSPDARLRYREPTRAPL